MKNRTANRIYPLFLIYALFFMWGFIWNLFNVLAAFFQDTFRLTNTQTALGTSLSFLAFFIMSYPAKKIITRIGTKKSIATGAFITGLGLIMFYPAATIKNYNLFLAGLFVLFSGVTILQTVCNPYVGILGDIKNRAARINFAQGIGAVGAALTAPMGGWFMLKVFDNDIFGGIKIFYLAMAALFILFALFVNYASMPPNPNDLVTEISLSGQDRRGVFQYRHFVLGLVIMFFYMGAEAVLYQLMTPYFKLIGNIDSTAAVKYSAIIFYGLMIGRLLGAWSMTKYDPATILGVFTLIAAGLVSFSALIGGMTGIYLITAIGFFISITFASIFALATKDLGKYTNTASAWLVMAISGGFFIPLIYGIVADSFNLKTSMITVAIPLLLASAYGFFYKYIYFNRLPASVIIMERENV